MSSFSKTQKVFSKQLLNASMNIDLKRVSTQNFIQNHVYFCDQMVPEKVKFVYTVICIRQHLRTMDSFCNYILKVHVKVLESALVKSNNFNQIHNKRMALSSYTTVRPKHKMAGSKTSIKFTDQLSFMIKWSEDAVNTFPSVQYYQRVTAETVKAYIWTYKQGHRRKSIQLEVAKVLRVEHTDTF